VEPRAFHVDLETVSCPLGCPSNDEPVLSGRDRLHELAGEFRVVRCRHCGLMRTNPRPTPVSIALCYPSDYAPFQSTRVISSPSGPSNAAKRPWLKNMLESAFDTDTRKIPPRPPGRMLEIGCASGAFLHRMAVSGWEVEGLDFSEEAAEAAQALGYPIHTSRLENSPDPEKPYDLVVGWHVFEHLHEPVLALQKLRRWTNPGAWLVLSMPDAGSWEFKIFKNRWYALQVPTHLFHYTPGTLRRILDRGGWRAERFFWHNNPNNLLQSLRYGCLDRGWNRPGDYLLDIALRRRHRAFHVFLGRFLGAFRLSGRMTIWAKHA